MTLEQKLQAGQQTISGKTILHTAPHHDDILLGYFPYAVRNLADNDNHVLYLTSGANGVSDQFLARHENMTVEQVAAMDHAQKRALKSRIRQLESEKKWKMCGENKVQIKHFQAMFYTAEDLQNNDSRDLDRIADYFKQVKPDIITVLVDEPGCGPKTHHQAADLIFAAIEQYRLWFEQAFGQQPDLMILGYRNIWSSFTLEQASIIIPVSNAQLDQIESIFTQCFASQHNTLIISPDCDPYDLSQCANFAQQATWIMREQDKLIESSRLVSSKKPEAKTGAIFLQNLTMKSKKLGVISTI